MTSTLTVDFLEKQFHSPPVRHTAYNSKIRPLGFVVRAPLRLSPRWSDKMSRYRLYSITAGTVSISITMRNHLLLGDFYDIYI